MKKRLIWAILALVMFLAYSVLKLAFSDFLFATHTARNTILSCATLTSPFVMTVLLIALCDKIKVRTKKLIPTIVLTFGIIAFIIAEFGINGEVPPFISWIFLIFAIITLAIRQSTFKVYFLANVVAALILFVINTALCFSQFQPAVLGAVSYGILSNILYGISRDDEPPSEEETLLKFEENVRKLCDL